MVAFVKYNGKTIAIAKGLHAKIIDTLAGGPDDHVLQWQVSCINIKDVMDRTLRVIKNWAMLDTKLLLLLFVWGMHVK